MFSLLRGTLCIECGNARITITFASPNDICRTATTFFVYIFASIQNFKEIRVGNLIKVTFALDFSSIHLHIHQARRNEKNSGGLRVYQKMLAK